jgi:hypothetical protein
MLIIITKGRKIQLNRNNFNLINITDMTSVAKKNSTIKEKSKEVFQTSVIKSTNKNKPSKIGSLS